MPGGFKLFSERTYGYYSNTMQQLLDLDPSLCRNFSNSVFASTTFNLGPQAVTFRHVDWANLSWGWCAITALGSFNPDLGGHIVLWDQKLVIRYPPGSTIYISSALLEHSNVPIQAGESRYSITQYSAAGLFRWVYNGFRSDKEASKRLKEDDEIARRAKITRGRDDKERWTLGLNLFSKVDEY
jgi:hypothetical protein